MAFLVSHLPSLCLCRQDHATSTFLRIRLLEGRRPKWRPTSRSEVIGVVALSQSRLAAMVMSGRDFSLAVAVLHAFDMASLALQHTKVPGKLASWLFSFLFFGFVAVLWLRPSTGDTLRLLLRRAAGRLRTETSHADRDFSLCSRCSARIRRGVAPVASSKGHWGGYSVARAVTSKGQGVFHSAGHKDCCVVELATLLFLVFFWSVFCPRFFGCGRRRETHFFVFVRIAPQVAGRQTSLSHADRDFSLALALLHAVDVRVAGVATCKCQRGDFLSLSSAKRLLAA